MRKKILWMVGGAREGTFLARIGDELEARHGLSSDLLTPFEGTANALRQEGRTCMTLSDTITRCGGAEHEDLGRPDQANGLLGGIDINMLLHSDSLLHPFVERGAALALVSRSVLALHKLLSSGEYVGCLRYGTGSAVGRAMSVIAESLGLPSFSLVACVGFDTCGLGPGGVGEQWVWNAFPRCWEAWRERPVSDSERDRVEAHIASYYERHRGRRRMRWKVKRPHKSSWERLRAAFRGTCEGGAAPAAREENARELLATCMLDSLAQLHEQHVLKMRTRWLDTYRGFSYDEPPSQYVYMPLNYSWDAPHRAWNPMNYLQEYIVRIVAESLPYGYELVIKEHPYGFGEPSHKTLQSLQRRGVRVVEPRTHSLDLIRDASAVFCVGDTTGWEAILFRVPVVVFGARPFYVAYPHLWAVSDPNQVHHALRNAVASGRAAYEDERTWYAFILGALESSAPGNIWGFKDLLWVDADRSDENVRNVADMIAGEGRFAC